MNVTVWIGSLTAARYELMAAHIGVDVETLYTKALESFVDDVPIEIGPPAAGDIVADAMTASRVLELERKDDVDERDEADEEEHEEPDGDEGGLISADELRALAEAAREEVREI